VLQTPTIVDVGFSRAELESYQDATVPDLIGPGIRLLFVGINPGLWTAATQTHFAYPGNRFYPALLEAEIIERPIDRGIGMSDDDRRYMIDRGIGITNVAHRATAKASQLTADELRVGGEQLRAFVRAHQPTVVAIAGITAYRTAFGHPKATMGEQPDGFEGSRLFVVPNPSGLNAHETVSTLAEAYAAAARAAGILLHR
jgi:TDG/mug DNA glycosylase family protein